MHSRQVRRQIHRNGELRRSDYPKEVKRNGVWVLKTNAHGWPSKSDAASYRKSIWPAAKVRFA